MPASRLFSGDMSGPPSLVQHYLERILDRIEAPIPDVFEQQESPDARSFARVLVTSCGAKLTLTLHKLRRNLGAKCPDNGQNRSLRHGEGWLSEHPERELITNRYLKHQKRLAREELSRLIGAEFSKHFWTRRFHRCCFQGLVQGYVADLDNVVPPIFRARSAILSIIANICLERFSSNR
jgi:hypothetical protein